MSSSRAQETPVQDVLLIGYGGVGAMYSYILTKGGRARITAVARSNYSAVKEHGVDIQSPKYGIVKGFKPHRVCSSVAEAVASTATPFSHVIVTTKALPEVLPTSQLVAPLLTQSTPQPTYVLVQNGLGVERDLYRALKVLENEKQGGEEPRVISCSLYLMMRQLAPTAVKHTDLDILSIGMYRPTPNVTRNSPHEQSILEEFASILGAGGTDVQIVPEIQRIKFVKNVWNSVMGPVTVLARRGAKDIFFPPEDAEPAPASEADWIPTAAERATATTPAAFPPIKHHTIPFIYSAFQEVAAVGLKAFPPAPEDGVAGISEDIAGTTLQKVVGLAERSDRAEKLSILVDAELGRPMEVEVIVGEMIRMGRMLGVDMPRMEALYAMMCILQSHLVHEAQVKSRAR